MQPEMRFKPRTDLERVYDMINAYKYGKVDNLEQLEKCDDAAHIILGGD